MYGKITIFLLLYYLYLSWAEWIVSKVLRIIFSISVPIFLVGSGKVGGFQKIQLMGHFSCPPTQNLNLWDMNHILFSSSWVYPNFQCLLTGNFWKPLKKSGDMIHVPSSQILSWGIWIMSPKMNILEPPIVSKIWNWNRKYNPEDLRYVKCLYNVT